MTQGIQQVMACNKMQQLNMNHIAHPVGTGLKCCSCMVFEHGRELSNSLYARSKAGYNNLLYTRIQNWKCLRYADSRK